MIVLDASITLSWHFADEASPLTDAIYDDVVAKGAVVPVHWRIEVANAFATAVRYQRLSSGFRTEALARLEQLSIEIDQDSTIHAWGATQALCDRFRLTAYDAAYLELASRRGTTLATLDRKLAESARALGVRLRMDDAR